MNTDMSGDEFRRYGHEVVDWIADYLENNRDLPVMPQISPAPSKMPSPRRLPRTANRWSRSSPISAP
jgi:aromatic-L-amino-acid/L-tryptophan decarboxylase